MTVARRTWRISLAAIIIALGIDAASHAQGVYNIVASPISSDDLDEYAAILQLSDAQRRAIEPAFQEYLKAFGAFRDGPVEELVNNPLPYGDAIGDAIGDEEVERRVREIMALRERATAIDGSFIDAVAPVLSESQTSALESVQRLRLRQRTLERVESSPVGFSARGWDYGVACDPARILREIGLSPEANAAVAPVLNGIEHTLTSMLREYDRIVTRSRTDQRIMSQVEREGPSIELGARILHFLRRTPDQICPLLNSSQAVAYRVAVNKRLFPGVGLDPKRAHVHLDAVDLDELTNDQREQVRTLRERYIAEHEALSNAILDSIARVWDEPTFWTLGPDEIPPDQNERSHQLIEQRDELNGRTRRELAGILGEGRFIGLEEAIPRLRVDVGTHWLRRKLIRVKWTIGGFESSSFQSQIFPQVVLRNDGWMQPLNPDVADSIKSLLGLDAVQRTQAEQLIAEFNDQYRRIQRGWGRAFEDEMLLWRRDRDSLILPDRRKLAAVREQRDELMQRIRTTDDELFARIAADVIRPDQADRLPIARRTVRRWRQMQHGNSILLGSTLVHSGTGWYSKVDLVRIAADLECDVEQQSQLLNQLASYESTLTSITNQRDEATAAAYTNSVELYLDRLEAVEEGYEMIFDGEDQLSQRVRENLISIVTLENQQAALTRTTAEALLESLPPELATQFEDLYRRAVTPHAFEDRDALHDVLDQAMTATADTDDQRGDIYSLRDNYRTRYRELTLELADLPHIDYGVSRLVFTEDGALTIPETTQQLSGWFQDKRRVEFTRSELNAATLRELRHILTEAQQKELGIYVEDDA